MTPSAHTWAAAGSPAHEYPTEPASGPCATCAGELTTGVPLAEIETPTTANHADYFRFGSRHVCPACAWLFGAGKGRPGNYIATPGRLEYAVISLESVVVDKRPWLHVLRDVAGLDAETPIAGVMTTDVKPRLWPRVRMATVGRFGLYVHAAEYDVSEWRAFDLADCLGLVDLMLEPLTAGYAKASLHHGLLRDHARAARDLARAAAWDRALSIHRGAPHFLPALIAAGVTKESKQDVKPAARPDADAEPASALGDRADPPQLGLF